MGGPERLYVATTWNRSDLDEGLWDGIAQCRVRNLQTGRWAFKFACVFEALQQEQVRGTRSRNALQVVEMKSKLQICGQGNSKRSAKELILIPSVKWGLGQSRVESTMVTSLFRSWGRTLVEDRYFSKTCRNCSGTCSSWWRSISTDKLAKKPTSIHLQIYIAPAHPHCHSFTSTLSFSLSIYLFDSAGQSHVSLSGQPSSTVVTMFYMFLMLFVFATSLHHFKCFATTSGLQNEWVQWAAPGRPKCARGDAEWTRFLIVVVTF